MYPSHGQGFNIECIHHICKISTYWNRLQFPFNWFRTLFNSQTKCEFFWEQVKLDICHIADIIPTYLYVLMKKLWSCDPQNTLLQHFFVQIGHFDTRKFFLKKLSKVYSYRHPVDRKFQQDHYLEWWKRWSNFMLLHQFFWKLSEKC